jgi:Arc/MetJ family transcription regulator
MMDELVAAVARAAKLPPDQAAVAVGAMLRFLTGRLPSALVGELHDRLQTHTGGAACPGSGPGNAAGASSHDG